MQVKYNSNQLRDYSSIFSRCATNLILQGDYSSIEYKIDRYDKNWRMKKNATYLQYIKYIYSIVESNYQNEYIYKNTLLNNWLMKELSETKSKIFSEYRVGNSIADIVMFNGVSKVFEIKTDLDSDKRLDLQLQNYKKAFNEIYLVIPESKQVNYKNYDKSIGIVTFNNNKKDFRLVRKAETNCNICSDTVMHILRTSEYKAIVKSYYGVLPEMTSFNMFNKCFDLIKKIPNKELNNLFISQMKKRASYGDWSAHFHKELNQICLALNLDKEKREKLIRNLKKPIKK